MGKFVFGGNNMNIIKLKQIRKSKGYTLSDLSGIIGCTSSYLSQLERGLKQPSLDMLRRISNCLNVTVFDLLSENESNNICVENTADKKYDIIRHNNRKKFIMPEILTEYEFITPYSADENDNSRIVGMYITLMPGKWSCEKLISLDFDFSIFIIQGTVTTFIREDAFTLDKWDSIYIYSGTQHNFYNAGDTELIMIGYGIHKNPDIKHKPVNQ
ncbi:helix-turn-helix domain-containing protein [Clostridium sp. 19966]|uniref:helix-turn-helix domain-containing protein n=1 Tax=Clostridium sp. 19966 TaxID=2768166 RepID=UPI0028DE0B14|nr:helix-turn-helix domain-containing protein [Clostridium sp. 19966]MDT8719214.1 helix-turn-helix domain-containing protein [Clostridium sp. 19966]